MENYIFFLKSKLFAFFWSLARGDQEISRGLRFPKNWKLDWKRTDHFDLINTERGYFSWVKAFWVIIVAREIKLLMMLLTYCMSNENPPLSLLHHHYGGTISDFSYPCVTSDPRCNTSHDDLPLWWFAIMMICHYDDLPLWWFAIMMICHSDDLPLWWFVIVIIAVIWIEKKNACPSLATDWTRSFRITVRH